MINIQQSVNDIIKSLKLFVVVQARRSHPNDANLIHLWQDVLKSAGLGAIASNPLLPEN